MNNWTFTGNLGKDCEIKTIAGGMTICNFSVAVKSGYGDKEKTTWAACALFGKRAEGALPQYLVKGAQVCISGEVCLDEWEKDGVTNKMLKVNVNDLDLIGGKQDGAPAPQAQQAPQPQRAPVQQAPQQQPMQADHRAITDEYYRLQNKEAQTAMWSKLTEAQRTAIIDNPPSF